MLTPKHLLWLLVTLYPVFGAAWQSTKTEQKVMKVGIGDDESYSPRVKNPTFQKNGPIVLLDQAHGNQHFDKAFAKLISADGFQVVISRSELTFDTLSKANILVIMNTAMFMPWKWRESPWPLFSDRESAAVRDWVSAGGSVFYASASSKPEAGEMLLSRLGVEFHEGHIVDRELTGASSQSSSAFGGLTFTRDKNTLASHSILTGRSDSEHVDAIAFNATMAIRKAPENAISLVHHSDKALLLPRDVLFEERVTKEAKEMRSNGTTEADVGTSPLTTPSPAPATAVAVAFVLGKGRVVVIGNGSAVSSVVVRRAQPNGEPVSDKVGLGEADNEKFTINVMHWLAGLLE